VIKSTRINECGHPELEHEAKGMCARCYGRARYNSSPEHRAKKRSWYMVPENNARMKALHKSPEYRAKQRAHYNMPKVQARVKAYRQTPERRAATYYNHTGISIELILPWFEIPEQDRRCWICKENGLGMDLDHNHKTLDIRGWAHRPCNLIEGKVLNAPNPKQLLLTLLSMYESA